MQPFAPNRSEEHTLAQRSFSLFDRRTLSALMLLGVVHCTSAAEEAVEAERQNARARIELAAAISALRQALGLLPEQK